MIRFFAAWLMARLAAWVGGIPPDLYGFALPPDGGAPQDDATSLDQSGHDEFSVHQHETWYNLSAYLSSGFGDLKEVSERLLKSGFARFVSLPDGICGWLLNGDLVFGSLDERDTALSRQTQFTPPIDLDPSLTAEAVWSVALRAAERNLFNTNKLPDAYIRVFCPSLRLLLADGTKLCSRLQLKLYTSGLVTVSFVVSEDHEQALEAFVATRVNLGQLPIKALELAPRFAYLGLDAESAERSRILDRWKVLKLRNLFRSVYRTQVREDGTEYVRMEGDGEATLAGIALDAVRSLAYCLGRPRKGLSFLLFGDRSAVYWTGFWSASPHIHLLGFSDQAPSALVNEQRHRSQLLHILARTPPSAGELVGLDLPQNLRAFDDLAMYINEAALLWVYAGLEEEATIDGTQEHPLSFPTIEHQVKGELIEAVLMTTRMLIHELESRHLSWDEVLAIWERVSDFDLFLKDIGRYGEVRDALRTALEVRGFSGLRKVVDTWVGVRERSASVEESRRLSAVGITLTMVVGLLGLPSFAQYVADKIFPLWGWGDLVAPARTVASIGLSVLTLGAVVLGTLILLRRRKWIRWNLPMRRE